MPVVLRCCWEALERLFHNVRISGCNGAGLSDRIGDLDGDL